MPRSPLASALALVFACGLELATARAAPPPDDAAPTTATVGIPPDREGPARDLLAPLLGERDDGLALRGPSIERDRIKWWLLRDGEARAILLLVPRNLGQPDDPRSKSFAIQIAWAPEVEPDPGERALLDQAIAAVQARDQGGFYVLLVDAIVEEVAPADDAPVGPDRALDGDPERVRLVWGLELVGVATLIGFALAVTLRPQRE